MKRILFLAMLLAGCGLFTTEVSAQAVLGRHAITSGYHAGADGSVDLDGTIGQSITGTVSIPDQYLTQGFHQPENNTPCPGDVNGDGLVSTTDILDVLGFLRVPLGLWGLRHEWGWRSRCSRPAVHPRLLRLRSANDADLTIIPFEHLVWFKERRAFPTGFALHLF